MRNSSRGPFGSSVEWIGANLVFEGRAAAGGKVEAVATATV